MAPKRTLPDPFWLAALDPGERTGFVIVKVGTHFDPVSGHDFQIDEQGVLSVRPLARDLSRIIGRVQRVVYEEWRLFPDKTQEFAGSDMQPSQVVGMIRYECWKQAKKINTLGPKKKAIAIANEPTWLHDHKRLSSEEHDKDAIDLAWYATFEYWARENGVKL
jgi:hypothetical protein